MTDSDSDDAARAKVEALEAKLERDPESRELREELLSAYCGGPSVIGDSRRLGHVHWVVEHFPREAIAHCPLAHPTSDDPPEACAALEAVWQRHVALHPDDPRIVCGLAALVATRDTRRAADLLNAFLRKTPEAAEVWCELGRICGHDPQQRLAACERARQLGSTQPRFIVWMAIAALDAQVWEKARANADELLQQVDAARARYGAALDWTEEGALLFQKALRETGDKSKARELIRSISEHAYLKHWGHTVLGMLALRDGNVSSAVAHLRSSVESGGDFRMSSYGPSFRLAHALCEQGQWDAVAAYLDACAAFWDCEELHEYRDDVLAQRLPSLREGTE